MVSFILCAFYSNKNDNQKRVYVFTIAETWKQPKCPLTDEWIKKMWYMQYIQWNTTQP